MFPHNMRVLARSKGCVTHHPVCYRLAAPARYTLCLSHAIKRCFRLNPVQPNHAAHARQFRVCLEEVDSQVVVGALAALVY